MSFKKKILAVAAVSALTAATAVPALALENEFHGMFRLKADISNFDNGGTGLRIPKYNPGTSNFVDQRARLLYMAKANDDLKLITHFEIDSRWGDASYTNGRNLGGSIGADTVNLETKSVYLDFNIPTKVPVNVKGGMQPFTDAYKGIFVNTDAAGVVASAQYAGFTNAVGWFRFDDRGTEVTAAGSAAAAISATANTGKRTRDLIIADTKYGISKDLKVGGSYYMINDDESVPTTTAAGQAVTDGIVHTLGVNAEANLGLATVDGFALYQFGNATVAGFERHISAWAANVGAKAKIGIGTARANFLYTSGEGNPARGNYNGFIPVKNETSGADAENTFYPAEMRILLRDKFGTTDDRAMVYNSDNQGQGIIGGFIGYDANITPKVFANANAGFVAVAKRGLVAASTTSDSGYMGTELNAEVGYKLYDNLTASVQGAYVILGDYYKGTSAGKDPNSPFLSRIVLNYVF